MSTVANIDFEKLQAEVSNLPDEEVRKQLLELRTKQRVNQKKYHNPERAKAYHAKRNAAIKAMVERAKAMGIYDQILAEAKEKADELIEEQEIAAGATEE